jgi:hypothetical protein
MKLLVKLLISVLVLGILLPFTILKGTDGKPLLSLTDLQSPDMPKLPEVVDSLGAELEDGKEVIYKWTDGEGNLQFSNSPPPEGIEYTVKDYDPDLNVIQAVKVEPDIPAIILDSEPKKQVTSMEDVGNPYSPGKIDKLFEDTKNIEKLLNQRLNNQEAIIGQ